MSIASQSYSHVRIETPENVELEFELAGPGTRMVAYLIDFILLTVVLFVLLTILYSSMFGGFGRSNDLTVAIIIGLIVLLYPLGGYFIVFELVMQGQTPGKRVLGIRVINENGAPAGYLQVVLRNLFKLVDASYPLQYIIGGSALIFTKKTQRLGDLVAGTLVIRETKVEKAERFKWSKKSKAEAFMGDIDVSLEEFNFIIRYIELFKSLSIKKRNHLSRKVAFLLIRKHKLNEHPAFIPLIKRMSELGKNQKYKGAETIMKKILSYYLAKEEGQ